MPWKLRLLSKARSAARSQDWPKAVTYYKKIYKTNRSNANISIQLAHALKESGDLEEAKNIYIETADRYINDLDAQKQACLFLVRIGDVDEAKKYKIRFMDLNGIAYNENDFPCEISPPPEEVCQKNQIIDNNKIVFVDGRNLTEEDWLSKNQKAIFKYLSGALCFKE